MAPTSRTASWQARAAAIAAVAVLGACVAPGAPAGRWSLFAIPPVLDELGKPRVAASGPQGGESPATGQLPGPAVPDGSSSTGGAWMTPPPAPSGGAGGGRPRAPTPTETPTDAPWPGAPPEPTQPPGCAPCDDGPRSGLVLAAEAPFTPLAGVTVTAGATTATSAIDGTFALPPPSASAEVVSLGVAGRATAAVAGWRTGALTLHLAEGVAEPTAGTPNGPAAGALAWLGVSGRVTDPAGAPVAGVLISAGAPAGAWAPVVTSAADGTFALRIYGAGAGGAADATVWAAVPDGAGEVSRLGAQAGVTLTADQDLGDVVVAPPSGAVMLAAPLSAPFAATPTWEVVAIGPGGVSFTLGRLRADETRAPAFAATGVTLEARATASGHDGATASHWRRAVAAGDVVAPSFARPPVPQAALALVAGAEWLWRPIEGMGGYRVEVRGEDALQRWEAFTALPRLTLPAGVPGAAATVRIVATSEGGLFDLASLRALRLFSAPERYSVWEGSL